jgi:hypothetical protein
MCLIGVSRVALYTSQGEAQCLLLVVFAHNSGSSPYARPRAHACDHFQAFSKLVPLSFRNTTHNPRAQATAYITQGDG